MTDPSSTPPTPPPTCRPDQQANAPTSSLHVPFLAPDGDVVPGDPPVPITVWHLPPPPQERPVPAAFARRLIANFTRPGAVVVDLTAGRDLQHLREAANLIISAWPVEPAATAERHLADCVPRLAPGGCLALVITATETPDHLGGLVTAARAAGLAYLQHIVVAHHLKVPAHPRPRRRAPDRSPWARHLRVHSDVLIFRRRGLE